MVTVELKTGEVYLGSRLSARTNGTARSRTSPHKMDGLRGGGGSSTPWDPGEAIARGSGGPCQIENITFTAKDGMVSPLEEAFIRGSRVRIMSIPGMLATVQATRGQDKVRFEEDDKDPRIWFLDHNYHEFMFSMFKRINGRRLIGGNHEVPLRLAYRLRCCCLAPQMLSLLWCW